MAASAVSLVEASRTCDGRLLKLHSLGFTVDALGEPKRNYSSLAMREDACGLQVRAVSHGMTTPGFNS